MPVRSLLARRPSKLAKLRRELDALPKSEAAKPYLERVESQYGRDHFLMSDRLHWVEAADILADPPEKAAGKRRKGHNFLMESLLPLMQAANPDISVRAESALEPELMQGLIEGRIDIGVIYTPQSRPGLKVEQLFEERLVMVSTHAKSAPEPQKGYVYVDWGPEFYARHSAFFPSFGGPALTANIGWLGLQHVMRSGGSGYFPMRIVLSAIKAGQLHLVANAPEFFMPAYVVYSVEHDAEMLGGALDLMHRVANSALPKIVARTTAPKTRTSRRR